MGITKAVIKMDQDGTIVDRYESVQAAADASGLSVSVICHRCRKVTSERDGFCYRYEDDNTADPEARRADIAAARARRTVMDRVVEEEQRLSGIKKIQRDSALRLLGKGMDVLDVSHITGLEPDKVGLMLARIRSSQPAEATGT